MICPNCEQELEAGKLYCAHCGYEINIVPNFEPEIENSIQQTLSILADEVSGEQDDFEVSMQKPDYITDRKSVV